MEVKASSVSVSKARRLRDAAVKRRLFQNRSNGTFSDSSQVVIVEKLNHLADQLANLTMLFCNSPLHVPFCHGGGVHAEFNFPWMGAYSFNTFEETGLSVAAGDDASHNMSGVGQEVKVNDGSLHSAVVSGSIDTETYCPEYSDRGTLTLSTTAPDDTMVGTGLDTCLWQPGSKHFIRAGSQTHTELEHEAASRIQFWCRKLQADIEFDAPSGPNPLDEKLVIVKLPPEEWRQAVDMHSLPLEAIVTNYIGDNLGQRDYDVGVWFKIDTSSSNTDQHRDMEPDQIKAWFTNMLRTSEKIVDDRTTPLKDRIRDILCDWVKIRLLIPIAARLVVAEGVFQHVSNLRKHMYEIETADVST